MITPDSENIFIGETEVICLYIGETLIWKKKKDYDETKIAVVLLDENMQETDTIYYASNKSAARSYLRDRLDNLYYVNIGSRAGVTVLGYTDFPALSNIYSIDIPSGVTIIGLRAFVSCSGLRSVSLPNTLLTIGQSAFASCSNLRTITVPGSVTEIVERAFTGCTRLTEIVINKPENSLSGAPWDAPNAAVIWTG